MADDNDRMKTLSGYDTTRSNIGDQDNNKVCTDIYIAILNGMYKLIVFKSPRTWTV